MRRPVSLTVLAVLAAFPALSSAYVGVNDTCSWPTPYPPPGAPWASVNNPGFEAGFTGGVGNQWIGWKDAGLPGQVHYDGTDRVDEGSHSQKLVMPTPTSDYQEAGIYQRLYVVPGETYTATVRVYLQIDNPDEVERRFLVETAMQDETLKRAAVMAALKEYGIEPPPPEPAPQTPPQPQGMPQGPMQGPPADIANQVQQQAMAGLPPQMPAPEGLPPAAVMPPEMMGMMPPQAIGNGPPGERMLPPGALEFLRGLIR